MKEHKNNFDFLRLFAASMVIIGHNIGYKGFVDPLFYLTHNIDLGFTGVFIFFIISGYLVTMSWIRGNSFFKFFRNRILRIFPGLLAVILFTIFIIGPLFTNLSFKQYFSDVNTYKYLINLSLLKLQFILPGVFEINGQSEKINPPLWTLVFEFMMYILVALFGISGLFSSNKIIRILYLLLNLVIIYLYAFVHFDPLLRIFKINVCPFIQFYSFFFIGSLFYLWKDKIKLKFWMVIALSVLWYFSIDTFLFNLTNLLFVASFVFYIAFLPYKLGYAITKTGDYSYGLYLYGSIVGNIFLVLFNNKIPLFPHLLLSLLCTLPFAILSWHLVEKKAMQLKK